MNKPESSIPEEMLSAYLDGELSADEQRDVELAIANNEELRNLLGELQQIRSEIQQLPRHTLSSDFAARITQATQQDADSNTSTDRLVNVESNVATKVTTKVDSKHVASNTNSRFRWVAGIAASAAAILVALWAVDPGSGFGVSSPNVAMTKQDNEESKATEKSLAAPNGRYVKRAEAGNRLDDVAMEEMGPGGMGGGITADELDAATMSGPNFAFDSPLGEDIGSLAASSDAQTFERLAYNNGQNSFDAVVFTSLTNDKVLNAIAATKQFRKEDTEIRTLKEQLAVRHQRSAEDSSMQSLEKESMQRLSSNGLQDGVDKDSLVMVIEGTREEIESRFAELNLPLDQVQLLAQHTDAGTLGIPAIAATSSLNRLHFGLSRQKTMRQSASPSETQSPAAEVTAAAQGFAAPGAPADLALQAPSAVAAPAFANDAKKNLVMQKHLAESVAMPSTAADSVRESVAVAEPAKGMSASRAIKTEVPLKAKALGGLGRGFGKSEESLHDNAAADAEVEVDAEALDSDTDAEVTPKFRILLVVQPK